MTEAYSDEIKRVQHVSTMVQISKMVKLTSMITITLVGPVTLRMYVNAAKGRNDAVEPSIRTVHNTFYEQ